MSDEDMRGMSQGDEWQRHSGDVLEVMWHCDWDAYAPIVTNKLTPFPFLPQDLGESTFLDAPVLEASTLLQLQVRMRRAFIC
jgi:hypothetical protein